MFVPFLAGELELRGGGHRVPVIDGTGAELLNALSLSQAVLKDAPRLRSLRSLTLSGVTVAVPLVPGEWCPLLERLRIEDCRVERRAVVVLLPRLKLLAKEDVDVGSTDREDAPELEELEVSCSARWAVDYRSFAVRAPALARAVRAVRARRRRRPGQRLRGNHRVHGQRRPQRHVLLRDEVVPRADDEDAPGASPRPDAEHHRRRCTVTNNSSSVLLHAKPWTLDSDTISAPLLFDRCRPYMKLDVSTMVDEETGGEVIQEEKLTCDIGGLMSRST